MVLEDIPEGFGLEKAELGKVALVGDLDENGIDVALLSEPHDADWSGEFLPSVERLGDTEADDE